MKNSLDLRAKVIIKHRYPPHEVRLVAEIHPFPESVRPFQGGTQRQLQVFMSFRQQGVKRHQKEIGMAAYITDSAPKSPYIFETIRHGLLLGLRCILGGVA